MTEKIIDTTRVWLDVRAVASLKKITERAVRLSLRQTNKYIYKTEDTRGDKVYKICLSSLEPELQSKYLNEYYQSMVFEDTEAELANIQSTQEKIIPANMKRVALVRMSKAKQLQRFFQLLKSRKLTSRNLMI
ncbi:MAG: hypothetical protein WCG23_07500 [bacterium]